MNKPKPGTIFPSITVSQLGGGSTELGKPREGYDWKLVVVYRGKHCPKCTAYLKELIDIVPDLKELGVDVLAVSADSVERAQAQMELVTPVYQVGYGLSIDQMKELGLYITTPREGVDADGPFAEPATFIINEKSELRVVDISNVPFLRPQLSTLVGGLKFMRSIPQDFPAGGSYE